MTFEEQLKTAELETAKLMLMLIDKGIKPQIVVAVMVQYAVGMAVSSAPNRLDAELVIDEAIQSGILLAEQIPSASAEVTPKRGTT